MTKLGLFWEVKEIPQKGAGLEKGRLAADKAGERAGPVTEGCINQCRECG